MERLAYFANKPSAVTTKNKKITVLLIVYQYR